MFLHLCLSQQNRRLTSNFFCRISFVFKFMVSECLNCFFTQQLIVKSAIFLYVFSSLFAPRSHRTCLCLPEKPQVTQVKHQQRVCCVTFENLHLSCVIRLSYVVPEPNYGHFLVFIVTGLLSLTTRLPSSHNDSLF